MEAAISLEGIPVGKKLLDPLIKLCLKGLIPAPYHDFYNKLSIKGAGGPGGLHQDFLEIDFLVVSDRGE